MSSDQNGLTDRKPHLDPSNDLLARLLRLVAATPTRRLGTRARAQLRALVEPRWQDQAACATADPEAWFPLKGAIPVAQVSRICAACPVNRSCLAVALLWNEDGIWAGTNPGQRTHGYRLLRHGVSAAAVVELLLTRPGRQPSRRWSGAAASPTPGPGSAPAPRGLPRAGGPGGQEAA